MTASTSTRWIRSALIVLVALIGVGALVGVVVREGSARSHGTEIALAMRGADPRELFRGHYVAIRLADDYPTGRECPQFGPGDWVALQRHDAVYRGVGQYRSRAEAQRHGDIAVRGTIRCAGTTVVLDLGVDRFYVNQRDATTIDRALARGRAAAAVVSVGSDGRARLIGLDVDGARYDLNW